MKIVNKMVKPKNVDNVKYLLSVQCTVHSMLRANAEISKFK